MGCDKALLPDPVHGTLLARQLNLLGGLGAREILVSCRADQDFRVPGAVVRVHDAGTHGPLAALDALFHAASGEWLLVLAVDLGAMSAPCMESIRAASRDGRGVVPRTPRGPEPLAALYPRTLADEIARRLHAGHDLSMHAFIHAAIARDLLRWYEVPASDLPCFANWNSPGDVPPTARDWS